MGGFGNIGIFQLIIVLLLVVLLFGTKRLREFGPDIGKAIRGFRSSMRETEREDGDEELDETSEQLGHKPGKQGDQDADFEKTRDREGQ